MSTLARRRMALNARKSLAARWVRKNSPSPSSVHVNRPLTNIAVAFMQEPGVFFADRIFPEVPVRKQSDTYFVWDRGDLNRDAFKKVGPGAAYPIGIKSVSDTPYYCDVYKYSELIADEERENADDPLNLDQTTVESLMTKGRIRRDREFATNFVKQSVWTGGSTGADINIGSSSNEWDDQTNGNWITDCRKEIRALTEKGLARSGIKLLIGPAVFDAIIDHPVTLDRIQSMNADKALSDPTAEDLARILRIGEVVVGESVYNSAELGAATNDSFILSNDDALLVYAPASPGINRPSGGYCFSWTGLGGKGVSVQRLRRDDRDADQIKAKMAFGMELVAAECGSYLFNVLS